MAKNLVFPYESTLEVVVPEGTVSGDPVIGNGRPAVALTDRGEGVGNATDRATVAYGGVWELPVDDTVAAEDTAIYITPAGDLTTDEDDGDSPAVAHTLFGYTVHAADPQARTGGTKASGEGTVNIRLAG